jgi:hypothetical protein
MSCYLSLLFRLVGVRSFPSAANVVVVVVVFSSSFRFSFLLHPIFIINHDNNNINDEDDDDSSTELITLASAVLTAPTNAPVPSSSPTSSPSLSSTAAKRGCNQMYFPTFFAAASAFSHTAAFFSSLQLQLYWKRIRTAATEAISAATATDDFLSLSHSIPLYFFLCHTQLSTLASTSGMRERRRRRRRRVVREKESERERESVPVAAAVAVGAAVATTSAKRSLPLTPPLLLLRPTA